MQLMKLMQYEVAGLKSMSIAGVSACHEPLQEEIIIGFLLKFILFFYIGNVTLVTIILHCHN